MRQIYKYQIIRYFPHILSEEFINVGVILDGSGCKLDKIITDIGASILYCPHLVGERKKFMGMVEYLHGLSSKGELRDANHYFNNFRFSEQKQLASEKKEQDILERLFHDYIGHKYPTKDIIDEKQRIIQTSFELVEKEFSSHLKIRTSNVFDFELESVKQHTLHHSIIGSSSNRQDVSKAIMAVPAHPKKKNIYDFLDMSKQHRTQSENFKDKLEVNQVSFYEYVKDDDITLYLEKIA